MKEIDFNNLNTFLKNPSPGEQFEINSISSFLKLVWKSFLIILVIDIITGVLIVIPLKNSNLFPPLKEINSTPFNILKITLILPVIEELIFRLPLRISKTNLITSFSVIIFLFLNKWCIYNIYITLSCSLILFFLLHLCIKIESNFMNRITIFFTNHFWALFYFQALVFGFLHLTNYILDFRYFFLFPLFILSYIITGLLWGYLRTRYTHGFYLCIASHIVINSIYCFVLSR